MRTFQPDNEDRVRGCYTSHIKVIQEIQKKMGKRANYRAIILEDNLETTQRMSPEIITSVAKYLDKQPDWDVFHLAYMMYVPGLSLKKLPSEASIVQMLADASSSVGTSAYVISKSGVEAILQNDKSNGYVEAIPNVMARLFPRTRYAAYPMVFHRAASIGSLVNPQLDDFRKIMFSPAMYTTWEKLMVSTGLQNNQLFPGLSLTLLLSLIAGVFNVFTHSNEDLNSSSTVVSAVFLAIPLLVAAWGASLFTSDKGFAKKKA